MKKIISVIAAVLLLITVSCGASTASAGDDTVRLTGIVQVLYAGTRSETVILTEDATGEVFALVGELAYDLVPEYGLTTTVLGRFTTEGYSVREDLRKVHVLDYSLDYAGEPEEY